MNAPRDWLDRQSAPVRALALFLFLIALFALMTLLMPGMNLMGPGIIAALVAAVIEYVRWQRHHRTRH